MISQTAPPTPGPQNLPAVPPGWKAEWSVQYARYFFVNLATNESVWILPTIQPTLTQTTQPVIQRKPVPTMGSELQAPASGSPQQLSQVQYSASLRPPIQQQDSPAQKYQNFSPPQTPGGSQQQYCYFPPNPQYCQPYQQNFTPSPTPASYNPQPCVPTPPVEEQRPSDDTRSARPNAYYVPPPTATNNADQPQHHNHNFALPPQQHAYYPQQTQSYQPAPPPQQHQQQGRSLSTFAPLSSNSTLKKWSSKLSQIQNRPSTTATPATARSASAAPTPANGDWKKWTKRAAIGVAAVGALALGVDAIGDAGASAFGGGEFSGGGDWSGGGAEFGDAASVDASAAQIAMEQQGQENALMLLDPPGTTYTVVDANSLI